MIKLVIQDRFISFNEYIDKERTRIKSMNKGKKNYSITLGSIYRKEQEENLLWTIKSQIKQKLPENLWVSINWYEKDRRRDVDNITWAKKIIFDALQTSGVLEGDGRKYIEQITDHVYVDKDNPRIEVMFYEGGVPYD